MQHWKCEVRLSLSLSFNTRWIILEACVHADWVYSVDSVSKIKSILSFIFHAIYGAVSRGCMYSAYPFLLWWLWEYVYFILFGRITIRWQSVVQKWWKMKLTIENWKLIPPNNQILGHNSPKYFLSSCNGCKVMHDCVKAHFLPK